MAKNLYRLKCPLMSEYDTENWYDLKVVFYKTNESSFFGKGLKT